ncbi:proteasome subunit alpha type-3-like [Teleopsis dalmanni]|uniref:proteasome subunit alpha type-3-like n=1 Tax=Teleopsis dalmanni TaxID=139649 RepID=UPI0018CEAD38|nr:proteasome subunit alpha type-3-like [Teleopsis dalmanni]
MNLIKENVKECKKPVEKEEVVPCIPAQFNAEGNLEQLSFAEKALEKGENIIALRGKRSVVLITEKEKNKLYVRKSLRRLKSINDTICCGYFGFKPDAGHLMRRMLLDCTRHWREYNRPMPLLPLVEITSRYVHLFTQDTRKRPLGCSLVLATHTEKDGPQLFEIGPSGKFYEYFACAGGRDMIRLKNELNKYKHLLPNMSAKCLVGVGKNILAKIRKKSEARKYWMDIGVIGEETKSKLEINTKRWKKLLTGKDNCSSSSIEETTCVELVPSEDDDDDDDYNAEDDDDDDDDDTEDDDDIDDDDDDDIDDNDDIDDDDDHGNDNKNDKGNDNDDKGDDNNAEDDDDDTERNDKESTEYKECGEEETEHECAELRPLIELIF